MRYYDITISVPQNPTTTSLSNAGKTLNTGSGLGFSYGTGGSTFTSYVNGQTNPCALQVEFDIPVGLAHQPTGFASLRVWGVGLPMISQAWKLTGLNLVLKAGMQKGLPLANPLQNGIILEGEIYQAFGNWQGVNQTLDIVFNPQSFLPPNQVAWGWAANTPIQQALELTTMQAFPNYTPDTSNITATLQQSSTDTHLCKTFNEWAQHVITISRPIGQQSTGNTNYPGVLMQLNSSSKTIFFYDNVFNTAPSAVKPLVFQDFIGQPTWIEPNTINFKTVLRADLNIGNVIKFPQGVQAPFVLTQANAAYPGSPINDTTTFQGLFQISRMQHFANFRQPDAESWVTTFDAFPLIQPSQAQLITAAGFS
jgi:hypothetical protein